MRRSRRQKLRSIAVRAIAGSIVDLAPLRVIEDVEGLGPELEVNVFMNGKLFEQAHVKVCAIRKAQNVSSGVAKGKAGRRRKSCCVEEPRTLDARKVSRRGFGVDIADDVRVRLHRRDRVTDAGIVAEGIVDDAEGRAGLERREVRNLPAIDRLFSKFIMEG